MNSSDFSISGLCKSYNGLIAVDNLSYTWNDHAVVGLIGPNGAGKTTLFNLLTGFVSADSGSFAVNGMEILKIPPHKVPDIGITRTFQNLRLIPSISVFDNVSLYCKNDFSDNPFWALLRNKSYVEKIKQNLQTTEETLKYIGLWDERDQAAETLSYGMQKILSVGCSLAAGGEYLLLDEPVSGVNPTIIQKFTSLVKELAADGKKIMIIEHNIEAVRNMCTWLIVMCEGRILAEGLTEEVLSMDSIVEAYLE